MIYFIRVCDDIANFHYYNDRPSRFLVASQQRHWTITWTRDSTRLIFWATSSRMNMSGYRVLLNSSSNTSNCCRVNVVRSRLCFLAFTPENEQKKNSEKLVWANDCIIFRSDSQRKRINSFDFHNRKMVTTSPATPFVYLRPIASGKLASKRYQIYHLVEVLVPKLDK